MFSCNYLLTEVSIAGGGGGAFGQPQQQQQTTGGGLSSGPFSFGSTLNKTPAFSAAPAMPATAGNCRHLFSLFYAFFDSKH